MALYSVYFLYHYRDYSPWLIWFDPVISHLPVHGVSLFGIGSKWAPFRHGLGRGGYYVGKKSCSVDLWGTEVWSTVIQLFNLLLYCVGARARMSTCVCGGGGGCVCTCVLVYVRVRARVDTHAHTSMHAHIDAWVCVRVSACACVCLCMRV